MRALEDAVLSRIMQNTWMGVGAWLHPFDAWVYQEIIWETQPDWIIEVGNHKGGTLLFLNSVCEAMSLNTQIVGVDVDHSKLDELVLDDPAFTLIEGAALEVELPELVGKGLVIEDSSHSYVNTLGVCRRYGALLQPGGYLIVEDGSRVPEVAEAVQVFLAENDKFVVDESREWPLSLNRGGFLRKKP